MSDYFAVTTRTFQLPADAVVRVIEAAENPRLVDAFGQGGTLYMAFDDSVTAASETSSERPESNGVPFPTTPFILEAGQEVWVAPAEDNTAFVQLLVTRVPF